MFKLISRLPLARQVLLITATLSALVFAGLISFVSFYSNEAAIKEAESALSKELQLATSFLDFAYANQATTAQRRLNAMKRLLPGTLSVPGGETTTGDTAGVPIVKAGAEVMNNNNRYLEELKRINTAEGFILARKGSEYVRVATLLKDAEGRSMVGKALKPDEPQVAALDKGQGYLGIIQRNNKSYMIIYEPILDGTGKVVGAYGLRDDMETDITAIRDILKKVKIGRNGYIYAFAPMPGEATGKFTIHPKLEGKTLEESLQGNKDTLALFKKLTTDKGGKITYEWFNPEKNNQPDTKLVVASYAEKWGWYLAAGTFLDELTESAHGLRNRMTLLSVLAGALAVFLIGLAMTLRLKPLGGILASLEAIGQGDLRSQPSRGDPNSRNELDILAGRIAQTASSMRSLLADVASSAQQVRGSAQGLATASEEVASASSRQSEAAADMAAAVEELTVSIAQVADHADDAATIAHEEKESSREGRRVAEEVIAEMHRIEASVVESGNLVDSLGRRSVEIAGIVRLIQDVAEQTNLLALNAAIEAARAGEQGRGFAVVADEVRKLAERTSSATREISDVIAGIQTETGQAVEQMHRVAEDVSGGVNKVQQAGEMLEKIETRASRTAEVIADIASATREQKTASTVVAQRLESVAQMAEGNTSITRRNREAAGHLGQLAGDLQSTVGKFRL